MTANRVDTKALRALLEQATPGPWRSGMGQDASSYTSETPIVESGPFDDPMTIADGLLDDDAALIAAAVNALPALLDAAERLEEVKG